MVSVSQSGSQASEILALTLILLLAVRPWMIWNQLHVNIKLDGVSGFHTAFTGSPRGHHRWEVWAETGPLISEQPSLSLCCVSGAT